jgi:hypothetical protein
MLGSMPNESYKCRHVKKFGCCCCCCCWWWWYRTV